MAAPQLKEGLKYKLRFQRGALAGQILTFQKAVVHIGRGTENDLVLTNDLRASRVHAEIRWDGFELRIKNLSSKNFIAVNGQQVESAPLEPGSIVIIGESEFRVDYTPSNQLAEPKTKLIREPGDQAPKAHEPGAQVLVHMPLRAQMPANAGAAPLPPIAPAGRIGPQIPHTGRPRNSKSRPRPRPSDSGGKLPFYGLVMLIGVVFVWLMNSNGVKKKELTVRSSEQIRRDIEASQEELKEFAARKERLDNIQYKRAQENYIRGFRDYKQGNYGRARESFQVVLNLDPENELAKRYYQLARLKFDERVKFHMLQGNRYREKKNWRMCKSSYFNVMTMVNNNQDPVFREAKQYYDQCSLAQEGRY